MLPHAHSILNSLLLGPSDESRYHRVVLSAETASPAAAKASRRESFLLANDDNENDGDDDSKEEDGFGSDLFASSTSSSTDGSSSSVSSSLDFSSRFYPRLTLKSQMKIGQFALVRWEFPCKPLRDQRFQSVFLAKQLFLPAMYVSLLLLLLRFCCGRDAKAEHVLSFV